MYERFSSCVHKLMLLANSEAHRLHHERIRPEHVLLAMTQIEEGGAAQILAKLDVDVSKVRLGLDSILESGTASSPSMPMGKLPQTTENKNVIQYAIEEAENLSHYCVSTQHILLGLLREQDGVPKLSDTLGITLEGARAEVGQITDVVERPMLTPTDPDLHLRNAIKCLWAVLPNDSRNADEVDRQIRRLVERALRDFREDFKEFLWGTND